MPRHVSRRVLTNATGPVHMIPGDVHECAIGRSSIVVIALRTRPSAKENSRSEVYDCLAIASRARSRSRAIFSKVETLASDRRNMILPRTDGAIRGNAD